MKILKKVKGAILCAVHYLLSFFEGKAGGAVVAGATSAVKQAAGGHCVNVVTIVKQMKAEGYNWFTMHTHTELWHEKDAKNAKQQYGVDVEGAWYWYEAWLEVVRKYCQEKDPKMKPAASMFADPGTAVPTSASAL